MIKNDLEFFAKITFSRWFHISIEITCTFATTAFFKDRSILFWYKAFSCTKTFAAAIIDMFYLSHLSTLARAIVRWLEVCLERCSFCSWDNWSLTFSVTSLPLLLLFWEKLLSPSYFFHPKILVCEWCVYGTLFENPSIVSHPRIPSWSSMAWCIFHAATQIIAPARTKTVKNTILMYDQNGRSVAPSLYMK